VIHLFKINTSKAYEKFRSKIGISIDEISKTINEYDKVTVIDLNNIEKKLLGYSEGETAILEVYLKKHSKHYNLTLTRKFADKSVVLGSYKIFPSILNDIENMTPIEALQGFVDIFGVEQAIVDRTSKLFYGEIVQQPPGASDLLATPIIINPKKGHEVLQTAFIKIEGITYQIFCGLAFCIDYTLYLDFLRRFKNNNS